MFEIKQVPKSASDVELTAKFNFKFPFRRYQQQILDSVFKKDTADNRFHIIAPPGSGKTVVGIELIKRLAEPAVVFAPNTTIQLQWKEQCLFSQGG